MMIDLRGKLLPRLESYRLPGLDAGLGAVYPYYTGYSLSNLPAALGHWLDIPTVGQPLGDEIMDRLDGPFRHVIFILADGMGLEQFELALQAEDRDGPWNEITRDALFAPLTSIAPSTTVSALTTLWTGVPPSRHGMMGYEMWLKEYSMIINAITQSPVDFIGDPGSLRRAGFQPETFLPVPALGPLLAESGLRVFAYHHQAIYRSSLSTMLLQGVKNIPYRTLNDLWVSLGNVLDTVTAERTYSYVYWGDLDELEHRFGPQDERPRRELETFGQSFARFLRDLRTLRAKKTGRTLLLLTADHGQIFTPRDPADELRNHPRLLSCLSMLPSGENRLAYLFIRPGREDQLKAYIHETWGEQVRLIASTQALEAGLFGDGEPFGKVEERIGDWIAIPQGNHAWWWSSRENTLLGRHGGLSRAEMLVPLIAIPV